MKSSFKLTEKDYRYLFENSSDAMWVHDIHGNFLDANKAFERISGRTLEEWSNTKVTEFITPETLARSREIKRKLLSDEGFEQPYEQTFIIKDGRTRVFQMSTSPVIIDGKIIGFQHVGRDVTEERYAEKRLSNIIDGLPIATFVIDKDHIVTHWNTAIQLLTGIDRKDAIGTKGHWKAFFEKKSPTLADLVVEGIPLEEMKKRYHGELRRSPLLDNILVGEAFLSFAGQTGKWLLFNACPLKNESGEITGAIETILNITEQKSLEENMRFYSHLILRAQEDERKRIARELHDDAAGSMLLVIQRLDALIDDTKSKVPPSLKQGVDDIRTLAVTALEGLRQCAQQLRPRILDDLGLAAAIEWIADDMGKKHGIKTGVKIIGNQKPVPAENRLLLFRIVQEALSNIRRHAKADSASVTIYYCDENIRVTITDNGIGFGLPERIEDLAGTGNLGLMGMSERVRLMQGTLDIRSEPGKGTEVDITVPYQTGGRFSQMLST